MKKNYEKLIDFNKYLVKRDFQNMVISSIENSHKILDIGCGIGDYLIYTNRSQDVTAVEPHLPYIEKAKHRADWVKFINEDALSFFGKNKEKFDLILMIDVVEHLNETDGSILIEEAKKHCEGILFAQIPIGEHPQSKDVWNLNGEYWQTHHSIWDEKKLIDANFSFYQIWENWYDWKDKDDRTSIAIWADTPLVSVVVPSYNQAEWLPKTLDSILSQTYPLWEAVVVDDGSTDNTWEIIQQYSKKDKRIKGFHKNNGGISSALNYGIEKAKGKYFCWLSSDDLFNPTKLELQIKAFEKLDNSYGLVFGPYDLIDANDNVQELGLKKPFFDGLEFPQQLKYDMVDGCTVMIPLNIMRELGGFNTQYKHAQDTEFWFRLSAKGYKFFYISDKLTKRRIHENQGFTDFNLDCRYDGYYIVNFYLSNYSFRDFYKNIDFSKSEDIEKFIIHFFDMISDPNCHINHPLVNDKFLNWFEDGLRTIDIKSRTIILTSLYELFNSNKTNSVIENHYLFFLKKLLEKLKNLKPQNYQLRASFADITQYDRSKENYFSNRLLNFGYYELSQKRYDSALSAFKYLSDFPNIYYEEAIEKFYEIVLQENQHLKFLRSFKRKNHITSFPDKIKFYYWFSKLKLNHSDEELNLIYNSLQETSIKEKIDSVLQGKLEKLPYQKILYLNYEIILYDVDYKVEYECAICKSKNKAKIKSDLISAPNKDYLLCKSCLNVVEFDENVISKYFESKISKKSLGAVQIKNRKPQIVFIMRYTNIIGGGVRVAYNYIQKLYDLGCEITIYTDSEVPTWISLPAKFIKVKDHYDIKTNNADAVVVFSIYDVPKILMKFDPERVYHLCQGYEGYHIGRNYKELRADKFFYTTLHSLPVKNILVSTHLVEMFEKEWGRRGFYIPNGINLRVFKPLIGKVKKKNSILFVGNPHDKLKGFEYLLESLDLLQNSDDKFDELNLYVVWGGSKIDGMNLEKEVKNIKVHFMTGLTPDKMAEVINEVSLLVSTSWYEGFTLPVLEAMACGVPTIVTKNMGAESFCKNNFNSFVVEYGDHSSLIKYLIGILRNKIDTKRIIKNGFDTASEYSELNSLLAFVTNWEKILGIKFQQNNIEKLVEAVSYDENKLRKEREEYLNKIDQEMAKSSEPIVSIIVPVFNQVNYTLEFLDSYLSSTNLQSEVIIVDDASTDNSAEIINDKYPFITIIHNDTNQGFPKAVNRGINAARGKYILIANNDVVITKNAIERMVEIAETDSQIGIVGPISNEVSGLQKDPETNYNTIEEMHKYAEKVKIKNSEQAQHFPRLAFLFTLIKREVIEKIGGLDERFSPGNYEDDDFCLRAQLAGYKAVIAKDVFIHHYGSKSFKANGGAEYQMRLDINRQKFVEKWGATPEEIWLQNKPVNPRQYYYPIHKDNFIKYFERTKVHIADNELNLAEESIYGAVINYNSDNSFISYSDLLNLAGNISLANNNLDKAAEYFETELTENSNSSSACLGIGQVLFMREQFEQAKIMFEWAVRYDKDNQHATKFLAEVNEKLGYCVDHISEVE